jgi:hypothetical protein
MAHRCFQIISDWPPTDERVQEDLKADLGDAEQNIALENHMYGVLPTFYDRWPILHDWFSILSTTKDRKVPRPHLKKP